MQDLVFQFLAGVLGGDGAQALRKASDREPSLEPLLVPRAALAWIESRNGYEGQIPGISNSYLRFQKHGQGYSGSVSLGDHGQYGFEGVDAIHVASALGVAAGVQIQASKPIRDRALVKVGRSIDALVKAQVLFKASLRSPSQLFQPRQPPSGYNLKVENGGGNLKVHAYDHGGNHVGTAWFQQQPQGLKPVTVVVDDSHQRRGLATSMYDHARHLTGMQILHPDVKTDEGEAFHATYKAEPPGQAHKPTVQGAPEPPQAPQKQPPMAKPTASGKLPRTPKTPTLKVEKTEARRPCSACGGAMFKDDRFRGCLCWKDLAKSVRTVSYSDGYVLEFGSGLDRASVLALRRALTGDNQ